MDLHEYVDRDVAPVDGETGYFSQTYKTSKGLPEMNLGRVNERAEFRKLVKGPPT